MSSNKYKKLIENFIDYLYSLKIINDIEMCAIGKETVFEYLEDIEETVFKSHNIDKIARRYK